MSSFKRKDAPGGNPSAKAAKTSKHANSSKRLNRRKDEKDASGDGDANLKQQLSAAPTSSIVTRLKDEEPMFPRGGAGILTPLEKKQIHLEAKADAARDDLFDASGTGKTKKRKVIKSTKKSKKSKGTDHAAEAIVKIESLNYKVNIQPSLVCSLGR
jgi:rRNA biogenesis protein RRP5